MSDNFPKALQRLIHELSRLPTIGRKSAQRLAFHLLKSPETQARGLSDALAGLHDGVHFCRDCFYLAEGEVCSICSNPQRDHAQICVVEEPPDVAALERTGHYRGTYHVLLGRLSPLQGVTPEDLKIRELVARIERLPEGSREVILATNPNVDGDATALYLSKVLQPLGVRVTRLGLGLPIGGALEQADDLTLAQAFDGRRPL